MIGAAEWPFVGRSVVLRECAAAIAAGRGVLIAGAAGVGKTRLARELCDLIEPDRTVLRVAGSISASVPPRALLRTDADVPVVAVDDIHLLDADAASLLSSLTVDGQILLVATLRTRESTPSTVTALWKDEHVVRVDLDDLQRPEVDEILDIVLDGPIDVTVRRHFWQLTLGSPLFLRELLRSSLADGSLQREKQMWQLSRPPRSNRLDDLIADRIDALDADGLVVVELVALGEPLGLEPLVSTVGLDALENAEESGLVETIVDDRRREVRLAHPVFGDVIRRRMGAARTAQRSGDLVRLLESTPMRRLDDIVRAATWQLHADGTVVTEAMVVAARRALYDRNELLAIELASRVADPAHPDAVLVLSEALGAIGQHDRADQLLREFGGDLADTDRALVAIQRAVTLYWGLGDAPGAERVLESVERSLPAGSWRDELRAERAVIIATQGRVRSGYELAEDLVASPPTTRVFVTAAIAGAVSMALDGRPLAAADLAARAYAAGSELDPAPGMSDPTIHIVAQALALAEAGRFDDSATLAHAAYQFSTESGLRHGQAWFALVLARTLMQRGHLTDAAPLFAEAAGSFARLHSDGPRRWALAGIVLTAAMVGDQPRAEASWAELSSIPDHPARMMAIEVERAEAWLLLGRTGGRSEAIARLAEIACRGVRDGNVSLASGAAHDVLRLGGRLDDDTVWAAVGSMEGELGPARAALNEALTLNDPAALDEVAERFAALGSDLFAAETWQCAASLHRMRGRDRAATASDRAAGAAQRRTTEDWLVTLDVVFAPPVLSAREREIATLAAEGQTNRDIAEQLFVSVRTVENHLQHVYERLGVHGRTELRSVLLRS